MAALVGWKEQVSMSPLHHLLEVSIDVDEPDVVVHLPNLPLEPGSHCQK